MIKMKKLYFIFSIILLAQISFSQKLDIKEVFQQHPQFKVHRYNNIDFLNKDTFFFDAGWYESENNYTTIQVTLDKGKTLKGYRGPNGPWGAWIGISNYVAYGGAKFGLQLSRDTLNSFDSLINQPGVNVFGEIVSYKNAVFINFDKQLYVSHDTLKTWSKCAGLGDMRILNFGYVSDSILVAAYAGGTSSIKLESTDFGLTWKTTKLANIPEIAKYTFGFLTPNTCYYTNRKTKHLYWSYDGGLSFNDSLYIDIDDFEFENAIAFANKRIGYFVVNGFDLYKTYNGGKSWELKHTFAPDEPIYEIKLFDSVNVFFLSYGGTTKNVIYYTENGLETIVNATSPQSHTFELYPNPANQSITLSTPNGQNAQLSIYNLMGQVQYQNPNQAPGNIDISQLATGLYIFELRQGNVVHRQRVEVVK